MALEFKYFVLKPRSKTRSDPWAEASRQAMLAYAGAIEIEDSLLAQDLREWVEREDSYRFNLEKSDAEAVESETFFADGSGFNGIFSRSAVVDPFGKHHVKKYTDRKTSNEMEYDAVITAMEMASNNATICTDSMLVVRQLQGEWSVKKKNLIPYYLKALKMVKDKCINIMWIPREVNLAGVVLDGLKNEDRKNYMKGKTK